jgi:hypothetical protein
MAKFRLSAMAAGFAMSVAFAGSAFAIESKADCEYEGGEVFNVAKDVICVVPMRAEEFHSEVYDGEQLGVKDCNGDEIAGGQFCKITLVKGEPDKPTTAKEAAERVRQLNEEAKAEAAAADKAEKKARRAVKAAE